MNMLFPPIAAMLWLLASIVLTYVILRWIALVETIYKRHEHKAKLPKERYFLYDAKDAEWVETTKDPTGGKHGE